MLCEIFHYCSNVQAVLGHSGAAHIPPESCSLAHNKFGLAPPVYSYFRVTMRSLFLEVDWLGSPDSVHFCSSRLLLVFPLNFKCLHSISL